MQIIFHIETPCCFPHLPVSSKMGGFLDGKIIGYDSLVLIYQPGLKFVQVIRPFLGEAKNPQFRGGISCFFTWEFNEVQ